MKTKNIQFRAWDAEDNVMSYSGEPEQFDDMLGFRFNHFGFEPSEYVTYMRASGLIDINGKELYDGDLFISKSSKILFRCWETRGGFVCNTGVSIWHKDITLDEPPINTEPLADAQNYSWFVGTCEIIGNIWENYNLITDFIKNFNINTNASKSTDGIETIPC